MKFTTVVHISLSVVSKTNISQSILRTLYFSFINPYCEYGNIVWAVKKLSFTAKIVHFSKKVIWIITNSPWCVQTYPLFHRLNMLKIAELHKLDMGCFVHKVLTPGYFSAIFCV